MERIYLDYAATTPLDPEVRAAMEPYLTEEFGNPNSLHSFGQAAEAALDRAREALGKSIGAGFRETVFTGSATEANNLALRGAVRGRKEQRAKSTGIRHSPLAIGPPKIIISAIEHESVLETARDLERDGVEVVEIPVDETGVIDLAKLEAALDERVILVSVMYASNEIGTVQPISAIAEVIRNWKLEIGNSSPYPIFHTDAVQAFQYLDCDVKMLGVDMMTLSAHKIGGPKGIGALFIGSRVQGVGSSERKTPYPLPHTLYPILTGGGQEFGLRAGTQNVAGAIGFAVATVKAAGLRAKETERVASLGKLLWSELSRLIPGVAPNGVPAPERGGRAVPHIWNISFPRHCARDLVVRLDMAGVAVSAGAACASRSSKESYVLAALGLPEERVKNGVRFSLGRGTTERDIREAAARIATAVTE